MAVYTKLSHADIADFLASYDVGELRNFKGIAEGVSNTNYLLTTNNQQLTTNYILTLFEKKFNIVDLPFFMRLTEYLADKGIICPCPIHNRNGEVIGRIKGKPAVLIEFLSGQGNPHITPQHTYLVGEMVAKLHIAAQDFPQRRENSLGLAGQQKIFAEFADRADEISSGLEQAMTKEFEFLGKNYPKDLPSGVIHADIFPDNVFFIDGNTEQPVLSGIIDFYFSCYDFWMYDLAIVLNAWCFNTAHVFETARADALFCGYNSVREITKAEKDTLNILARVAAMRFLCTRSRDWLSKLDDVLVNKKDPMEYVKKLRFWQEGGWKL